MTELGPALVACLLSVSVAAVVLRRWGLGARCLVLAAALLLALAEPAGLDAVVVVSAAGAPLVAVLDPRRSRAGPTWLVCGALVAATVLVVLATDPFRDPACIVACSPNPLAVGRLAAAPAVATLLLGAAGVVVAAEGIRRRSALGVLGAALTWAAITGLVPVTGVLVAAACLALVRGAAEVLTVVEARGRLADTAVALEQSEDPATSLRQQLHDPTLSIAFVLPDGSVVGEDGGAPPEVHPGQQVDLVPVGESTIARIGHGTGRSAGTPVMVLSGTARVALDNARLLAVSRRNARLLRESRARVVSSSDAERRQLERDLHDGAQQEVLSLGLALREELAGATDPPRRAALEDALARIPVVLESLREIGHGLRPAGLGGAGLVIALESIADRAPVPVDVAAVPEEPLGSAAVSAIAGLVARSVRGADGPLTVEVSVDAGRVTTVISGGAGPVPVEADRFATLGGDLEWDGAAVHAWLPTQVR